MHCELIEVEGITFELWSLNGHPGYTISDDGGWLDGVFDSRESAIEGFKLTLKPNGYDLLVSINKRVNWIDGENRLITMADLAI